MPRSINLLLLAAIVVLVVFAFTLLPGGLSSDVAQIGTGRPAAVLTHDPGLVQSMELMNAMSALRDEFEPGLLLLVADPGQPDGAALISTHALQPATVVLFDSQGEPIARHTGSTDEASVRRFLQQAGRGAAPAAR
jgi:hypothetical protein